MNHSNESRWQRSLRSAWRIARPVIVVYLLIVLWLMFAESSIVYPIPPVERGNWNPVGLNHEDVTFHAADGTRLHGWFVPHPNPRRAILYCHGNGEHVADNADLVRLLRDKLAASVFIFDYRGYGHSEGKPSETGCIADGRAARDWLAQRIAVPTNKLVLMGRSIGGGVAVTLASEAGAQVLVLENAFSSMCDVAAHHYYWWLPVRLCMDNRYDSVGRIGHYSGPLFQSHGTDDRIVPLRFDRRLFDTAPGNNKRFVELSRLGHNDPPPTSYYLELAKFLDDSARAP